MDLLAIALAPGIAICLFIFHKDAFNREPKSTLLIAFVLGMLTIFPAIVIERGLEPTVDSSIAGIATKAFIIVALTEELVKFMVLRYYAFNLKNFDEPLDGIVYSVIISMGFATLENVLYVQSYGMQVGIYRMFLAVPAHGTFGVLMGYFAGKAKFDPANRSRLLLQGLLWATFFHGAYDFFLFLQSAPGVNEDMVKILLFLGAVASLIVSLRLSFIHIKKHRLLSLQQHQKVQQEKQNGLT